MDFSYDTAFSRNIGWVTPEEQLLLRSKRVAIAGLGGVGGSHLITLTRLGVGNFNISDFDRFGIENFNRQFGASMSTAGQPKIEVLGRQALDINPTLTINSFSEGVNEENIDAFLAGVDLYVDSLDFFAVKARRLLFAKCKEKGISAITAAPLGMSCAFLAFLPGRMSFEEYFRLEGHDDKEQLLRFLVGLAPARLQNRYLVYPEAVDIPNHKGPSTPMAIELCAGIAGAEALKILLCRGKTVAAPWSLQFDAYRNKLRRNYVPIGNNNPLQKLALVFARKKFGDITLSPKDNQSAQESEEMSDIEKILDLARWAPSGDNSQPWCFDLVNECSCVAHIEIDTNNPYEYNGGEPTILSAGMLLETIRIAATAFNLVMDYELEKSPNGLIVRCHFETDNNLETDNLFPYIKVRSVNRSAYQNRSMTTAHITELEQTLNPALSIDWYTDFSERWKIIKLNALATDIRLRLKRCYQVHTEIVDWDSVRSSHGVPAKALGLSPTTLFIMRWAMQKWARIRFMNSYMGATLTARLEMDVIPGLNCAAHFCIRSTEEKKSSESLLKTGMSLQRFWLTATKLGLAMQPGLAPICFSNQADNTEIYNGDNGSLSKAKKLKELLTTTLASSTDNILFAGRIGYPKPTIVHSRSIRKPVTTI